MLPERNPVKRHLEILTVGHSTRSIEEFIALLKASSVELLADIRTIPRSRRHPHFNKESLPKILANHAIRYKHMGGLGGLRKPKKDSLNTGWRNDSFRGYADYMQTEEFDKSLQTLVESASEYRVALMCAEAVPWRCHRSLVADALVIRGIKVGHIMNKSTVNEHKLTSWANVQGTHIFYPPETLPLSIEASES